MKALFALFFSMTLAAVWEFIEYGCDLFLGTDMQQDTIVSFIHSYLLGGEAGEIGALENIADVIINGQPLGVGGYLDIGLHDTMQDMLVETLGAAVYTALLLIDREKHPVLYEKSETPHAAVREASVVFTEHKDAFFRKTAKNLLQKTDISLQKTMKQRNKISLQKTMKQRNKISLQTAAAKTQQT